MLRSGALIIAITRGLVRSRQTRRMAMFVVMLAALLMLFAGATFLSGTLMEHPFVFICYWAVCGWLTMTAVLLALFDLLALRADAAREKRRLKAQMLVAEEKEDA